MTKTITIQASVKVSPSRLMQLRIPLVVLYGKSSKIPMKLYMQSISTMAKNSKWIFINIEYEIHWETNYRHLDGTVLHSGGVVLDALTRPSLLITDAYNSKVIIPARKSRYAAMFGRYKKKDNYKTMY